MNAFDWMKSTWTVVNNANNALDEKRSPFDRLGAGATSVGTALTSFAPTLGFGAVAGPLMAAGGMGLQLGSFIDKKTNLSSHLSDAMVDTDEESWKQGLPPVHFRGDAGNAEARLLGVGRQQSFLKDETARQVEIAKWAGRHGEQPDNPLFKTMLRAHDIDVDRRKNQREMLGLFGHFVE